MYTEVDYYNEHNRIDVKPQHRTTPINIIGWDDYFYSSELVYSKLSQIKKIIKEMDNTYNG